MEEKKTNKTDIELFFKKGSLPSKQVVLMRKDLFEKLKLLSVQRTSGTKTTIADLLNNIIEHFFQDRKKDIDNFIKKCREESSKILD